MGQRRFSSTDHLSTEAIAAFVDHELSESAMRRACDHIAQCPECYDEIVSQRGAAERLRSCKDEEVHAPSSLIQRLGQLCDNEDAVGDLGVEADGAPGKKRSVRSTASEVRSTVEQALRSLSRRG